MLDINSRALLDGEFPSAYSVFFLRLEDAFQVTTTRPDESSLPVPRIRLTSQTYDPSLVLTWLSICRDKRGDNCIIHPRWPMATLRLVDVHAETVPIFSQTNETSIPP